MHALRSLRKGLTISQVITMLSLFENVRSADNITIVILALRYQQNKLIY